MANKFDVVVMNPPYQPPVRTSTGGYGSRHTLWDKFVQLALDVSAPDGHLVHVHPPAWRKPKHKLWEVMKKHQLLYLEIHDKQEGLKVFGATTSYDWYVLRKNSRGPTEVKFEGGAVEFVDLTELPFLPNFDLGLLRKVLAGEPAEIMFSRTLYGTDRPHMREQPAEIMFSQLHESRKSWMREVPDDANIYPCVHATPKTKPVRYFYSSKKSEFFVPKVIFGDAQHICNAIVDFEGNYGLTQHAMALPITSRQEGEQIKQALESTKFNVFLRACRWSNFRIDWRMFQCLRRDFWKEFLREV